MRIGVMLGADGGRGDLDGIVASGEAGGIGGSRQPVDGQTSFPSMPSARWPWLGAKVPRIGLGTAVTPTYPRHPTALAQQALTTAAATGQSVHAGHRALAQDRHRENMLGFSYDKPARHMREYLDVLMPLLRGEAVNYDGEQVPASIGLQLAIPGADPVPTVVAGARSRDATVSPAMFTDGTNTWMVGPKTMENHIVKRLTSAADAAGRPAPRVVGGVPIALTNQPDAARESIATTLTMYGQLRPTGDAGTARVVDGPADIAIVGDENALRGEIDRFRNAGVTDFNAAIMNVEDGAYDRTLEFLSSLV